MSMYCMTATLTLATFLIRSSTTKDCIVRIKSCKLNFKEFTFVEYQILPGTV